MVDIEEHEEDDGQRIAVAVLVGYAPGHYFGCHIAGFTHDAGLLALGHHIVIVADENVSCFRIDEEVAIVQVLIAVTETVEHHEAIAYLHSSVQHRVETGKLDFRHQEVSKLEIVARS